ncbi:gamma-aminobutyric acid receptor subunit beta-2-like [Atheta coriaria]|uniref:gamma-aminobutyric acid receptor subunit beta-2-like n=1 Tax=Dalotia coriaria TaxID=877792 RepID=UPI0031F3E38F
MNKISKYIKILKNTHCQCRNYVIDVVTYQQTLVTDSLNYEVDLILQQRWRDPRLGYNLIDEKNDYLNAIYHYGDIWLPNTYFVSDDSEESSPHDNLELTISPNGTVNYLMGQHLNLSCLDIINTFPVGDPICSFKMKSQNYRCLEINLKVATDINYYINFFLLIILVDISFITFLDTLECCSCESLKW